MSMQNTAAFPSVVLPPDGWVPHHEKWGLMTLDNSPGGRLVRLADVLEHIERTQVLARDEALSIMAEGLRKSGGLGVFILSPGQRPRPLSAQDTFGFQPPAPRAAPAAPGLGSPEWRSEFTKPAPKVHASTRPPPGVDHGSPGTGVHALVQRLRTDWVSKGRGRALVPLDDESKQGARVAILLSQAHALWQFGHAVPLRPPASWSLETEWGYMARDATPGGRLVRLDDLVAWLAASKGIPLKPACSEVEAGLASLTNADLFKLRTDDYAIPFDGSEDFTPGISERSFWEASTNSDELGIASVKVWLSAGACPCVALLMVRAYDLWGYGAQSDRAASVAATADGQQPAQAQALPLAPALAPDPFEGLNEDQRRRMKELTDTDQTDLVKLREELKRPPGKTGRAKSWTPWQRVTANHLQGKIGMDALAVILGRDVNTLIDTLDDAKVRNATATLNRLSGGPSLAANPTKRP